MSNTEHNLRRKIASGLMSAFVLAVFIGSIFITGIWIKNAIFGPSDPRRVVSVEPLHVRSIDVKGKPKLFQEPIVSVTFDDGWESTYTKALPILQKYGIPTTQYIIAGELDDPTYLSVAQIKSIQKAGHEIGSHTMTHPDLTSLDAAELNWQLAESKRILSDNFGPIYDFASPLGAKNEQTIKAIRQIYRSQRNTEGDPDTLATHGVNIKDTFTPDNVTGYTVRATTTMEDLREMLDYATKHNGWVVLTYHQVDDNGETFSVTPEILDQQLKMISEYKIKIATMNRVLMSYKVPQ